MGLIPSQTDYIHYVGEKNIGIHESEEKMFNKFLIEKKFLVKKSAEKRQRNFFISAADSAIYKNSYVYKNSFLFICTILILLF